MCETLDLERGGTKETLMARLMDFFLSPVESGKGLLSEKKKRSRWRVWYFDKYWIII